MKNKSTQIIAILSTLVTLVGIFIIVRLNVLPTKLLIIVLSIIVSILLLLLFLTVYKKSKVSKVLLVLLAIVMGASVPYTSKLDSTLRKMTNHNIEIQKVLILVDKDESFETIEDVLDIPFGANTGIDDIATQKTVEKIEEETGTKVHIQRYDEFLSLLDAFSKSAPRVMMLNESHIETISELNPNFMDSVKIIKEYEIEIEIDQNLDTNTNTDTFSIYISGLDFAGDISGSQRSDANIVLTVNPLKNQILMTSIPRDTFVVRADNGQKDKLSLVGNSGMNNTVKTIENFLEMEIDYTLKVNWSSVVNVVNALGGVEVDSPYSFRSGVYYFNKGYNQLNGDMALAFVTNRKNLPGGEESRVENQQVLLKAMINKLISPSIIINYHSFLDAVSGSIELNMPNNQLNNLIKSQLNSMKGWEIFSLQIIGDVFDTWDAYSLKGRYQVAKQPRPDLLKKAQYLIEMMENNESISNEIFE